MVEIATATFARGAALPVDRERRRVVAPASRYASGTTPSAGPAAPADRYLELRLLG